MVIADSGTTNNPSARKFPYQISKSFDFKQKTFALPFIVILNVHFFVMLSTTVQPGKNLCCVDSGANF